MDYGGGRDERGRSRVREGHCVCVGVGEGKAAKGEGERKGAREVKLGVMGKERSRVRNPSMLQLQQYIVCVGK